MLNDCFHEKPLIDQNVVTLVHEVTFHVKSVHSNYYNARVLIVCVAFAVVSRHLSRQKAFFRV